ncbi:MAG TPA: DNA gyrase inhibitor YacG [Burkholderiaceae bacterium]|nr:DNA gyrase inhibitor YacG [Burkholderiaceae bacterium]
MAGPVTVQCPTCGRPTEYSPRNLWRPFCSERCRGMDLGAWASERFRIASPPDPSEPDDEASAAGANVPTPPRG